MVSCEKYLKDFILFDINMCSKLMEQILSTTYKIRNELYRLKVSLLIQKIRTTDQNEKIRTKKCGPKLEPKSGPKSGSKLGSKYGPKLGPKSRAKSGQKLGPNSGPQTGPSNFEPSF